MSRYATGIPSRNERIRVLVVDGEDMVRESLVGRLAKDGYTVESAHDGESVVEKLRAEPLSVLIVDLEMPGLDGAHVLEEAKRIQPDLAVVILTAYETVGAAVAAMKAGAYGYLVKPFDPEEPSLMIRRIAAQRDLVRENQILRKALQRESRSGAGSLASLEEVEKRHIAAVLAHSGGNVSQSARVLGIDRVTLYNKMRRYGLRRSHS